MVEAENLRQTVSTPVGSRPAQLTRNPIGYSYLSRDIKFLLQIFIYQIKTLKNYNTANTYYKSD